MLTSFWVSKGETFALFYDTENIKMNDSAVEHNLYEEAMCTRSLTWMMLEIS